MSKTQGIPKIAVAWCRFVVSQLSLLLYGSDAASTDRRPAAVNHFFSDSFSGLFPPSRTRSPLPSLLFHSRNRTHFSLFIFSPTCEPERSNPTVTMFRRATSTFLSRAATRRFSTDVATPTTNSSFVEAWRKVSPNIDPPKTPLEFLKTRPPVPSTNFYKLLSYQSYTWLLPIYFVVSLGCYGLLMVGVLER